MLDESRLKALVNTELPVILGQAQQAIARSEALLFLLEQSNEEIQQALSRSQERLFILSRDRFTGQENDS